MAPPPPSNEPIDVLIVGGGISGLCMALTLLDQGVKNVRVIEKNLGIAEFKKRIELHPRTLEIFERLNVLDNLVRRGTKHEEVQVFVSGDCACRMKLADLPGAFHHYILGVGKWDIEGILTARLGELGIQVEHGVSLVDFDHSVAGQVTSRIQTMNGATETIVSRFLIGADGVHSPVRDKLGFRFEGKSEEAEELLTCKARLVLNDSHVDLFNNVHVCIDQGHLMIISKINEEHYSILVSKPATAGEVEEGYAKQRQATVQEVEHEIAIHPHTAGIRVIDPVYIGRYRSRPRLAERYASDNLRCFLIGDAAHNPSPIGGQGTDTGVQDAYNLAWKLALVLKRDPRLYSDKARALLSSYEAERRSTALRIVSTSKHLFDQFANAPTRGPSAHGPSRAPSVNSRNPFMRFVRMFAPSMIGDQEVGRRALESFNPGMFLSYTNSPLTLESSGEFQGGPVPGAHCPDVFYNSRFHLQKLLVDVKGHILLYFMSRNEAQRELSQLYTGIASTLATRLPKDAARVAFVTGVRPQFSDGRLLVLVDPLHDVYNAFGLENDNNVNAIYIVRPDGYIMYRSTPANVEEAIHVLESNIP